MSPRWEAVQVKGGRPCEAEVGGQCARPCKSKVGVRVRLKWEAVRGQSRRLWEAEVRGRVSP